MSKSHVGLTWRYASGTIFKRRNSKLGNVEIHVEEKRFRRFGRCSKAAETSRKTETQKFWHRNSPGTFSQFNQQSRSALQRHRRRKRRNEVGAQTESRKIETRFSIQYKWCFHVLDLSFCDIDRVRDTDNPHYRTIHYLQCMRGWRRLQIIKQESQHRAKI